MPTKHVTHQIEAYLDNDLSAADRRRLEEHIAHCPTCAHRLFEARRLGNELGTVMKKKLGHPTLPPALRYKIRDQLQNEKSSPRFQLPWATYGRILNAVGTFGAVAVLLLAAFFVIRGQLPGNATQVQLSANPDDNSEEATASALPTPMTVAEHDQDSQPTPITSLGDSLTPRTEASDAAEAIAPQPQVSPENSTPPPPSRTNAEPSSSPPEDKRQETLTEPSVPDGTIAFAFFNAGAQFYEIHLVDPDGKNRRRFPVAGVSEPALHRTAAGDYQIAYRAWGAPTAPRALISNDWDNTQPETITNFWEDSHPDWSPTENRIIFASQRESDRRWRLYTAWGDGSYEENLQREGKSPTFAPDGFRFAFVGCEEPLNRTGCGLLVGDLETIAQEATLILGDGLAESPDWSPTGEAIAYMANPTGDWDLYMVDSHGGQPRQLTDDPAIDGLPVWSPDGDWLAFLSNRSGRWGIWALHVASGHTQLVVDFNEGDVTSPGGLAPYQDRTWQDEQLSWVE